jgi:hypothetical protein
MKTMATIRREEVLRFFDTYSDFRKGDVAAVGGLIGEDLGTALVQRYFQEQGVSSEVLLAKNGDPETPRSGHTVGRRLDRWLFVEATSARPRTLYQVEIKMCSATAIGGRPLALDADEPTLKECRRYNWSGVWDDDRKALVPWVEKVLDTMRRPGDVDPSVEVQPMLCSWVAIHPDGLDESLFEVKVLEHPDNGFARVWVFSMSNYLRSLRSSWRCPQQLGESSGC